jgi:hypothetical protein
MEICQWLQKASHESQGLLRLQWRAEIGEEFPSDKLRRQPRASVDFTCIEKLANAKMFKPLQQPSFAPQDWGNRQC